MRRRSGTSRFPATRGRWTTYEAKIAGLNAEIGALEHATTGDPRSKYERTIAQGWVAATCTVADVTAAEQTRVHVQRLADLAATHEAEIAKRDAEIASKARFLEHSRVSEKWAEKESAGWRAMHGDANREVAALKADAAATVRSLALVGIEMSGPGRSLSIDATSYTAAQTEDFGRRGRGDNGARHFQNR